MDFAGLFSSLQKFDQWSESPHINQNIDVIISKVSIYICHISHLIYGSYDAFNTDDLDKTSRQKLQFEKVIIPIL